MVIAGIFELQNLLIGEDGVVKIADFGISKMLGGSTQKLTNAAGTPAFMSPELCAGEAFSGQLADIWAMGATIFMLCFGHPPFMSGNIMSLYVKIQNDPLVFPAPCNPGLKDLLTNMLIKDPTKRFTLQQVLMHPWMRQPPAPPLRSIGNASTSTDKSTVNTNGNSEGPSPLTEVADQFRPPASYDKEEADAMRGPMATVDHDELFMSIGVGGMRKVKGKDKGAKDGDESTFDVEECSDEDDDAGAAPALAVEEDENIMATKWGADVFEMVDDEDADDSDDEVDEVDDDEDGGKKSASSSKAKLVPKKGIGGAGGGGSANNSALALGALPSAHSDRAEMSREEEERRAKRFQHQARRSNENVKFSGASSGKIIDNTIPTFVPGAMHSPHKAENKLEPKPITRPERLKIESSNFASEAKGMDAKGTDAKVVGKSVLSPSPKAPSSPLPKFPIMRSSVTPQNRSTSSTPSNKASARQSRKDEISTIEDEETDELSMDDFGKLMDTLAMQPKKKDEEEEENAQPIALTLKANDFSVELSNTLNSVGAAFHSDQGVRETQEDR